jgi:hypothetical protein
MQRSLFAAAFLFFVSTAVSAVAADSDDRCAAGKAAAGKKCAAAKECTGDKCAAAKRACDKAEARVHRCEAAAPRACKKIPAQLARCERKLTGRKAKLDACLEKKKNGGCEKQKERFEHQQSVCKGLEESKARCEKPAEKPVEKPAEKGG